MVVRLSFDVYRYSPSRLRASQVLGRRMSINAVKGYAKYFQQVEALVQKMKLQPAQDNILKLAMAAKGTSAGDYTTRLLFLLDPETTTEAALKVILQQLLEIMQQNTSGCIRGIDVEYLHDYCNALKKTCYVIKQFHDAIPQAVREKHDEFFTMVNQLVTAVREKDLQLLRLQDHRKNQKKSVKKNIDLLQENLLHAREKAHQRLKEVLKSPEYRENIVHWREYLKSTDEAAPAQKSADLVYRRVDEAIWQLYQQALEESSSFAGSGDIKTLHQLHTMFEKFGYLLEFFRSLYPATSMHLLIKELNGMRDRMTGFVELDEFISAVQLYIKQLDNKKDRKAVKKIIKKLEKQLAHSAAELSDIHETFSSSYYRDKFREMFIDYHQGQ